MINFIKQYQENKELCKNLLENHNVKITPIFDGNVFLVVNEDNDLLYWNVQYGEDNNELEVNEYTKLFSKPVNEAIKLVESNQEAYKKYNAMRFEMLNDKLFLSGATTKENQEILSTEEMNNASEELSVEIIPTLWDGKLNEEQIDAIINILENGVPEGQEFINWLKQWFGEYEYFNENSLNESKNFIEGIMFLFEVKDRYALYKIFDPVYKRLLEDRKAKKEAQTEKNKDIYEAIYSIFNENLESYNKEDNKFSLLPLEEAFLNMMKNPKTYNKLMNLGSKLSINENKYYSVQTNMVIPELSKEIRRNGNIYKQLFGDFVKYFYK